MATRLANELYGANGDTYLSAWLEIGLAMFWDHRGKRRLPDDGLEREAWPACAETCL